eukprot:gene9511-19766_t
MIHVFAILMTEHHRDARRYAAPGRISNHLLFEGNKSVVRQGLVIARDYRVINYNVWRFYELVHGGGPVISRRFDDIYSPVAYSILQALIMIQVLIRCYLAKKTRDRLYTASFSSSLIAKKVMAKASEHILHTAVQTRIAESSKDRVLDKLEVAAILTQTLWRHKKRYIPEENLERRKRDQEVFDRARVTKRTEGVIDEMSRSDGMVVTDVHPIVHIGNTGIYTRTLTEDDGVPFTIKRVPGGEGAVVEDSEDKERFRVGSK